MLQAALADCQFLDLLPFTQDGFVAPAVDVGRCDVVQALVVALVVVVIDEGPDLAFKVARQVIMLQQNSVLHGLVCLTSDRAYRTPASLPRTLIHNSPKTTPEP